MYLAYTDYPTLHCDAKERGLHQRRQLFLQLEGIWHVSIYQYTGFKVVHEGGFNSEHIRGYPWWKPAVGLGLARVVSRW